MSFGQFFGSRAIEDPDNGCEPDLVEVPFIFGEALGH